MQKKKAPHLYWTTLSSRQGQGLAIFDVRFDQVQHPTNPHQQEVVVIESQDAATVVATTRNNQVVLVRQYRFGSQALSVETPGGFVDAGEDSATAIRRELAEETGFTSDEWEYLGVIYSNPVFIQGKIHCWAARNVERTQSPQQDKGEAIEVEVLPMHEVKTMLNNGTISHPHTIATFAKYFGF